MARFSLKKWIRAAAVAAAIMVLPTAASAQVACIDHDTLVDSLAERFQERQLGYGLVGDIAIMELYVSPRGSWTVVMTDIAGRSCIVAVGEGWETTAVAAQGEGA